MLRIIELNKDGAVGNFGDEVFVGRLEGNQNIVLGKRGYWMDRV